MWNLPGTNETRDCINIVNLSHPSPSSEEANTDVIHNQRQKTVKVNLLGSRARLDRLVARFLRWYKVSFNKCSLWFSINFTMEGSLLSNRS